MKTSETLDTKIEMMYAELQNGTPCSYVRLTHPWGPLYPPFDLPIGTDVELHIGDSVRVTIELIAKEQK